MYDENHFSSQSDASERFSKLRAISKSNESSPESTSKSSYSSSFDVKARFEQLKYKNSTETMEKIEKEKNELKENKENLCLM